MRATPTAVPALAALLLLTACGTTGDAGDSDAKQESTACSAGSVSLEAGPASAAPAAGDTGEVPVTLTNRGEPCTLEGFPEVRLTGTGESAVEVPPAEGATAQKLTLAKGASASFTLTYERGTRGDGSFDAVKLHIGLPGDSGDSGPRAFPWSYGPVAADGQGGHLISVSAYQQTGD
ncbi:DUF4232 domain-containing protein [Streptomyces capillispiralis]|uniref:Uncharacterized protein DUF4232 n=1 Tax=Streptomyces capillispiralis TaxID=68182 RepID=A0A561TG95_9ACTN|nr:DUF4232 domain-containing protein [Streptomyces capillispiralis]TWF86138.1 uncharacterized protein DUF4232 [Streptomyces capillispiralis]GHH91058.1 hypothetical protein GCM10017779_15150 [Streptomyces capillispiralis]